MTADTSPLASSIYGSGQRVWNPPPQEPQVTFVTFPPQLGLDGTALPGFPEVTEVEKGFNFISFLNRKSCLLGRGLAGASVFGKMQLRATGREGGRVQRHHYGSSRCPPLAARMASLDKAD